MDEQVIPSLNRTATVETAVTETRVAPPAPVVRPTPVIVAPPPRVELVVKPPGDRPMPVANNPEPFLLTTSIPVSSTNLAPDISTYPSSNEPYFQLSSNVVPPADVSGWYLYPTQNGSVQFDVSGGTKLLTASGDVIAYDGQSLMPYTWYLNPALNGEIILVDACGNNLLQSIDGDLYYNNQLLAKAGDIQQIADWSFYPAINPAGVDFDGHRIYNASDISGASATSEPSVPLLPISPETLPLDPSPPMVLLTQPTIRSKTRRKSRSVPLPSEPCPRQTEQS